MASTVELAEGWEEKVLAAWDKLAQERLGPDITKDAKRYAPVNTGELRESISFHMAEGHRLVVRADAPYSAYVEMGTRPHIIRPHDRPAGGFVGGPGNPGPGRRGGHSLRWFEDGDPVFAWLVHHPGTRPEAFLRPALFAVRGED